MQTRCGSVAERNQPTKLTRQHLLVGEVSPQAMKNLVRKAEISLLFLTTFRAFLVVCLFAGCKPKQPATLESKPQSFTNSFLQAELDRIGNLPFEHDPTKRPLVLSQPASNRRQWAFQALQRGYRATGKTNGLWDSQVERAFGVFADYTRISTTNWPVLKEALMAVPNSRSEERRVGKECRL